MESVITRMVNCRAVEILRHFTDLMRCAAVELPDLGSNAMPLSAGENLGSYAVVRAAGRGRYRRGVESARYTARSLGGSAHEDRLRSRNIQQTLDIGSDWPVKRPIRNHGASLPASIAGRFTYTLDKISKPRIKKKISDRIASR